MNDTLAQLLQQFVSIPGRPEALDVVKAVSDLIDERIKASQPQPVGLCNHDLFASANTLVLQSRTVTCEHCIRSLKL
jgi:hypothetical protein